MSGAGCLTVPTFRPTRGITVWTESARVTAKMVVHPGREGVDAGTQFQALSLDGSGQVASLGLDAGILGVDPGTQRVDPGTEFQALGLDAGAEFKALGLDAGILGVDAGVDTRPEGIDPRAKVEEATE